MSRPIAKNSADPLFQDFRKFFALLIESELKSQGKPGKPSKIQLIICDLLQKSWTDKKYKQLYRRLLILGYRGFGKTLLVAAFLLWILYRNPNLQIKIWGSNEDHAKKTAEHILTWINTYDWLAHLRPSPNQRQSGLAFDVGPRGTFRGASVEAYGITGGITGSRADLLLVDDPETSSNGETAKKRQVIDRAMNEAVSVIKEGGHIIVLGTPHFLDNLYLRLINQGYKTFMFPMAAPTEEIQKLCWKYYVEPLKALINKTRIGETISRFSQQEVDLKKQTGNIYYERQILVNPFHSSSSKKPFDLSKAIPFDADSQEFPTYIKHNRDRQHLNEVLLNYSSAQARDCFYDPYDVSPQTKKYDYKLTYVDPAGDGKDEMAVVTMGFCMGYAVLLSCYGLMGGSTTENLDEIIGTARHFGVNEICIEDNFGGGFFSTALSQRYQGEFLRFGEPMIPISTHRQNTNKEKRIMAAIDPILNNGRLVVHPQAIMQDYESSSSIHDGEEAIFYRLTYQISYFSESGEKLEYDDRLDALASCLIKMKDFLAYSPVQEAQSWDTRLIEEIFSEDAKQFNETYPIEDSGLRGHMVKSIVGKKFPFKLNNYSSRGR